MYSVQLAGLGLLFVQCRNKFGGPTYAYLQTNNADATQNVNKNCEKNKYF